MTVQDRRALIVGLDRYKKSGLNLECAGSDADAMATLIRQHHDGAPNYHTRLLIDTTETGDPITRAALREACRELFSPDFRGDSLFYFSGHGVLAETGGWIATYDAEKDDWGVTMQEIVDLANRSGARDILIILDCCYGGSLGNPAILNVPGASNPLAALRENMTVIAASRASQVSVEAGGHGLFTAAVLDALSGGSADHMGWVTAPSIYAYVERRFGAWEQRPVYKSHATRVSVIRECAPLVDRLTLRELVKLFPAQNYRYLLDPEYEPEDEHGNCHEPVDENKVAISQLLKDYRDAGLLKPSVPGEQLFWTARRSHTVELTPRGQEYWWLVANNKI